MKVHILGICGTFMGGIARLAQAMGHEVRGCDAKVYPPMSTQLEQAGIHLIEGYDVSQLDYKPDVVIVGNAMTRGNELVEYVLNKKIPYTSGPQWLHDNILQDKWVLAVSGTHGKTTTSSLLTWILDYAGLNPSYLIGGVPENFGESARCTDSQYFVIEADEYDTAFFDKRSKFVHYEPKTLIINNIEFDHADIFENLAAIKKQFHHLVRIVPQNGLVIAPANDHNVRDTLDMGCWTPIEYTEKSWQAEMVKPDCSEFRVVHQGKILGTVRWALLGHHNVQNALAAIAAANHAGVDSVKAIESLTTFKNVKRRLEIIGNVNGITVYDDFAHHPTAIKMTIEGLRAKVGDARIITITELGSNTMRDGTHKAHLIPAFSQADEVMLYLPDDARWQPEGAGNNVSVFNDVSQIIDTVKDKAKAGDHILIMSNRGFGGIHQKLVKALS